MFSFFKKKFKKSEPEQKQPELEQDLPLPEASDSNKEAVSQEAQAELVNIPEPSTAPIVAETAPRKNRRTCSSGDGNCGQHTSANGCTDASSDSGTNTSANIGTDCDANHSADTCAHSSSHSRTNASTHH
jgi:hypothetical protein